MNEFESTNIESRFLLALKLDAQRMLERISDRSNVYLQVFALQRRRDHFEDIFTNRYKNCSIMELSIYCNEEIIRALDVFYNTALDVKWYLDHTQDMPKMIEDNLERFIRTMKKQFDDLSEKINMATSAESVVDEEAETIAPPPLDIPEIPEIDAHEEHDETNS